MTNRDLHEVDEPKGGDERAFKAKHKVKVTDHPEGTKLPPITTSKKKRLADPVDTETTYEEVESVYSIFWRDANGMDKQKHGLSEEEVTRLASALEGAGSRNIFIDEEKMTDAQMKTREKYVKGMKSKDDDFRKRYGKRWKDVMYAIATKNAMKEEAESLDEIAKSEEEPLHTQLRKRTNANEVSLTFKNGKTHVVSRGHANRALTMLSGMKPADRQHAHAEMSKSHEHFMDALDGKIAKPGKVGVSLAGPKMKSEEVESLDEVGVPPTTYGGKPQPAPQPVSRPAPKPPEKKTATATTVKEAGDVIPPSSKKMKSFSDSPNNYKLDKPRAKSYNVPTQKDRSLEMDE